LFQSEPILFIPHKLLLTESVIRKSKMVRQVYGALPKSKGTSCLAFTIYLMLEMRKKPKDRQFRYMIDLLPTDLSNVPLMYKVHEVDYLTGSPMRKRLITD
jgi:hypothetical protein